MGPIMAGHDEGLEIRKFIVPTAPPLGQGTPDSMVTGDLMESLSVSFGAHGVRTG